MVDVIKWCMELGVTTISVYAFSIENFNRNEAEVEFLMKLSQEKFQELMEVWPLCLGLASTPPDWVAYADELMRSPAQRYQLDGARFLMLGFTVQDGGLMSQRGLDVRILGDLSRAPPAVREAAASVEATSARMVRKCGRLNIMFSYTATDELSRALARRRCLQQPDAAQDCHCASCSVVAHASALSPSGCASPRSRTSSGGARRRHAVAQQAHETERTR